jgi:rhamnosyltransferase
MTSGGTAAGVVAFRPNPDVFLALARRLASEADRLFVFLNDATDTDTMAALRATGATIIESPYNLGVGEAFNQLALHALWAGYTRLAIFDDDSTLAPGSLAALGKSLDALEVAGERPAVVGPLIVSPANAPQAYRPPRYFRTAGADVGSAQAVLYVISSGSLINLDAFRRIGRFRSDFFMDAIDTEWCFRARKRGYSCWVDTGVELQHRIGAGVTRANLFGRGFPKQPPMRLFAYIRNQIYCLRLPQLPLWWRALLTAHLARLCGAHWLDAEDKPAMRRLIGEAMRNGLNARLGPPPQAERAARLA